MKNKLSILANSVLLAILLSGCRTVALDMSRDKDLIESKKTEAEEFDEGAIQAILENNDLLDKPDEALFWSLENKQPDVAKWLVIKGGADVNVKDKYGSTPLHRASEEGHTVVAELLIKAGADLNVKDNCSFTALHSAVENNHADVVEVLINAGAHVNGKIDIGFYASWTPLHLAAFEGHIAVAELLLKSGANINELNQRGETPCFVAELSGKIEMLKFLKSKDGR
jgi:ankyrin repeat protein